MATSARPQYTDFSRDVMGRYLCNGLDEARPDLRPFDVIVVGGGSFGSAVAQHIYFADTARKHRILVLEAGPLAIPEHYQNLPKGVGLVPADPTSIADLRMKPEIDQYRWSREVWGIAWHSPLKFPGLAYCVGGRSLFWGGWSPQLLPDEMPLSAWPTAVVDDLNNTYFGQAADQIGTSETNDFIFGPMHAALRHNLFTHYGSVSNAVPLAQLPLHLKNAPENPPADPDELKLEAPLAVQTSTRSGFFPFNKFSALPLLMKALRDATDESGVDDTKKRLMLVPMCHVERLKLAGGVVTEVVTNQTGTNQGIVPVPPGGVVIIALGTIESTRLALNSLQGLPNYDQIGKNLMAHLRANLLIQIPRSSLSLPGAGQLETSALFLKGQATVAPGQKAFFHLQITASGRPTGGGRNAEAELFQKIPDLDSLEAFQQASDDTVVVQIRGIGEMQANNENSFVRPDPEADEFGLPRAFVQIAATNSGSSASNKDAILMAAMQQTMADVAGALAGGNPFVTLSPTSVDGLGTTHHEAGTLRMGEDPTASVTAPNAQFHHVGNLYAIGPSLHPTMGSPNPMLTGIALARRLGDRLAMPPAPIVPADGFQPLFDGFSTGNWQMAGPANFIVVDGALEAVPGNDIGLYWCTTPTPPDFALRLEWLRSAVDDNSGVFVRFPDPTGKGYNNQAYVGVDFGFEVQIDELGKPDGAPLHRTGAIYDQPLQMFNLQPACPPGQWNTYEIRVQGQTYTVTLNGVQVTQFSNTDPNRGRPSAPGAPSFIGLQSHTGRVLFRNIRIQAI